MTNAPKAPGQREDVEFLVEEFDIQPAKAAQLVAHSVEEAELLTQQELQRQHEVDPLAAVPTPEPSRQDFIADADEDALKPILHHANNRQGAG